MIFEKTDFSLKEHNTFGLDARCRRYIEYTRPGDLPVLADDLCSQQWIALGQGSNILFRGDFDGMVLRSRITQCDSKEDGEVVNLRIGAGLTMDEFVESACQEELWGLENLSGIPGTVGASAVQNVGAYGVEASDVIKCVDCFDVKQREFVTLSRQECRFGYRDSIFKRNKGRYIVTHVTFSLRKTGAPNLDYGFLKERLEGKGVLAPRIIREEIIDIRNGKLPRVGVIGSCGSFFKNPVMSLEKYNGIVAVQKNISGDGQVPCYVNGDGSVKVPAAWFIDRCGFKGYVCGNVAVWEKQPLVLVNLTGRATASELTELASKIIREVRETYGVILEREVEYVPGQV